VVPLEDVKDSVLEADGLQQTLAPVAAAAMAAAGAAGAPNSAITAAAVAAPSAAWTPATRRGLQPVRKAVR
jgi:hypothetical protein